MYTNIPIYQYITKIRGWDVFSIVFKKKENFSLNVFINMVIIKKRCVYPVSSGPRPGYDLGN